ncbi:hypothetical protein P22_3488 [Propionispora sp. 2/2-37]|uniref:hypothetical protein n=1 Tax=Propionispora sp. 2/2-37 TaxID=1677858 RepID=UPI0006C2E9CF|nr:hypothetical protein [Propionispora sp. 2/2-37]CUH97360.1 hypothetical protein P22_3488 [Propionispora sp. 2/2-37]
MMFKNMRRSSKLMSEEDTIIILKQAEYGTLATLANGGVKASSAAVRRGVPGLIAGLFDDIKWHQV